MFLILQMVPPPEDPEDLIDFRESPLALGLGSTDGFYGQKLTGVKHS